MPKFTETSNKLLKFINSNKIINSIEEITKKNTLKCIFESFKNFDNTRKFELQEEINIPKRKDIKDCPSVYNKTNNNNNYKSYFNKFNQNLITKHFNININNKILQEMLYNNNYISLDVIDFAESNDLIYHRYTSDNITLNIFFVDTLTINIDYILLLTHVINNLSFIKNKTKNKLVTINILLSPNKKVLYDKTNNLADSNILTQFNVNSGMSFADQVYVWRQEEVYKVLVHELIHNFDLDDKTNTNYKHNFNINQPEINTNEAYVEVFAEIINCVFINYVLYKNMKDFEKYIIIEINYSAFQTAKILNFFKIKSLEDILNKNLNKNIMNQTSNVFSYYIIKAALLLNILNSNTSSFINLIEESLKNKDFSNCVNRYLEILNNTKTNKDEEIFNNLRMTCLEIIN